MKTASVFASTILCNNKCEQVVLASCCSLQLSMLDYCLFLKQYDICSNQYATIESQVRNTFIELSPRNASTTQYNDYSQINRSRISYWFSNQLCQMCPI